MARQGDRGTTQRPPVKTNFFQGEKLAHIYYLFIYVLTDTKIQNFVSMKVKEFIDWIRPITALNPETDLKIIFSADEFVISHLHITDKEVTICLTDPIVE